MRHRSQHEPGAAFELEPCPAAAEEAVDERVPACPHLRALHAVDERAQHAVAAVPGDEVGVGHRDHHLVRVPANTHVCQQTTTTTSHVTTGAQHQQRQRRHTAPRR
eukprot:scaffold4317_cov323-Prasinococcus_capsulatus_cf.AAC.5